MNDHHAFAVLRHLSSPEIFGTGGITLFRRGSVAKNERSIYPKRACRAAFFVPHRPKVFLRFTPEPLSLYPQRMARRVVAAEFNAAVDRAGRQRRTGAGVKRADTARTVPFFRRYISYSRNRHT